VFPEPRSTRIAALAFFVALVSGGCGDKETTTSTEPSAATASATASATAEGDAGAKSAFEPAEIPEAELVAKTLDEQRAAMLRRMQATGVADKAQAAKIGEIMAESNWMGQGNPESVEHPMTRRECQERRKDVKEELESACGAPFMAPIYDTKMEKKEQAHVCIDRYEFPSMPCDYPVTWVTTREAQKICKVLGKRVCDAHEWEGACAGSVLPIAKEYAFGRDRDGMRGMHDIDREIVWAYGKEKDHSKCGTSSKRSKKCESSGWKQCGSNTYPAGSFPECRSPFGVYDLHGNAAEHMLLPMKPEELGRDGGEGVPEMKGSWFIFNTTEAHIDDCRWRSPPWHANEGMNHRNYHLGFRCCKDIKPAKK
jgi:formylglycine-generating enzyme required for sulfatase activity